MRRICGAQGAIIAVVIGLLGATVLVATQWLASIHSGVNAQAAPVARENGDTNGDGVRDLSDAIHYLSWLYLGGPEPVAIAGSSDLQDRVQALEEVAFSEEAALSRAVQEVRKLTPGAQALWDAPAGVLEDTGKSGTPARATLSIGAAATGRVVAFRLDEELSIIPCLDIIEEIPIPSYAAIRPGTPLKLSYQDASGRAFFHGEVAEASLVGSDGEHVLVHIRGFDKMHRLTRGRKSRTFLEQKGSDVVSRVLTDSGVGPAEFEMVLEEEHPTREQVVQYNETDFDFVTRLLAEEGIYFVVLHSDGGAMIRFGDGVQGRVPPSGDALPYPGLGVDPPAGSPLRASALRRTLATGPTRATVGDYDALRALPVFASAGDPGAESEDFDFGVDLTDPADLANAARRQLELLQSSYDALEGASNSAQLRPGKLIAISGVERSFNGKYLVTGVTHRYFADAGGGFYGNIFRCIPESARYRPPRRAPKPGLAGVQSAVVTGPPGQTIYTDAYGRVKVRFHWDRAGANDESSSAWVRVSQNRVAGPQSYFLPEVGDEVLVGFEHGDIDRPVIIGSLWNGEDRPPR